MGWLNKAREKLRNARYVPPELAGPQLYERQREQGKLDPDASFSQRLKQVLSEGEGFTPGWEPAQLNERKKKEKEQLAEASAAEAAAAEAAASVAATKAAEDKKKQNRLALTRRRGRRASILTGPSGLLGDTSSDRPMARSAALLGGTV